MKTITQYTPAMKKVIFDRVKRVMTSDPKFKNIDVGLEVEEQWHQSASIAYHFSGVMGSNPEPVLSIDPDFTEQLSDAELQFVTNHEKAHLNNGDLIISQWYSCALFSSCIVLAGNHEGTDAGLAAKIGLMCAVGKLLNNSISRKLEFKADQDAVHDSIELCDAAVTFFQRHVPKSEPHLQAPWWKKLFSPHPTPEERIENIQGVKTKLKLTLAL